MCLVVKSLRFAFPSETSEATNRREFFGGFTTEVARGDVVGILGFNGSGKTTLIRVLTGVYPTTESVEWHENYFEDAGGGVSLEQGLGPFLLPWLSGESHADILGRSAIGPCDPWKPGPKKLSRSINELLRKPTHLLSGGERQLIALSLLFGSQCPVIFLDEPFSALDAERSLHVVTGLASIATGHKTLFLVSHRIDHLLFLCTVIWVLNANGSRIHAVQNIHTRNKEILSGWTPTDFLATIQDKMHQEAG